jgi:hypothetical protein
MLVALQTAFTLLALTLRPYISTVLNGLEVACSCLELAYLTITAAAYMHMARSKGGGELLQPDAHLKVISGLHCCPGLRS